MTAALRIGLVGFTAAWIVACGAGEEAVDAPVLADLSSRADEAVDLVDREEVLAEALDWDLADEGTAIDMADAPDGFYMLFDGSAVSDTTEEAGLRRTSGYSNVLAGLAAVTAADLITLAVVGPPSVAVVVAADGEISQLAPNVWYAENTVPLDGIEVTTHFTVAWVAVGWLAEMRISTDDGAYSGDLWFNGFLGAHGAVGWWDLYDRGSLVGVVEWVANGHGDAQFGMAALAGPGAGSVLSYVFVDDTALIAAHDGATGEDAWVYVDTDHSGQVRLPEYNAGEPACWDADLLNTECASDD